MVHPLVNALNPFTQTLIVKSTWSSSQWVSYEFTCFSKCPYFFQVDGQGFKVDASRLTAHSDFLHKMLFDSDGHLGVSGEGTVENPIVVLGCTAGMFANFLGWLNHKCV